MKNSSTNINLVSIAGILILLVGWELAARSFGSEHILPGPLLSARSLINIVTGDGFFLALLATLGRGLTGFLIALFLGLVIGLISGMVPLVEAGFRPALVTIRSTPVISIILLALIWFRVDQVPVFIGFLTMFPIIATNITKGINYTDRGLMEMARLYQVRKARIIREIYLPSTVPYLFSAITTAVGFGWRAIIIGEVLSQPRYGIGTMMQNAQSYLLVAELIAWTVIAIVVGFLFEILIKSGEKRWVRWKT